MQDPFKEAYKGLNSEQKQAVDTIEGPVMVVAGPGTGKTQILTLRIANILRETDASPDSILALTFTESGVVSMRERLQKILGTDANRVSIHTFHGFCSTIIDRFPEEFPHIIGSRALDDAGKVLLVREALEHSHTALLRPLGDPEYYLMDIVGGIASAKREYVSPETLKEWATRALNALEQNPDAFHTKGKYEGQMKGAFIERKKKLEKHVEFANVYAAYQTLLRERKVHDFEDMIVEVVSLLETKEDFLRTLQEEYLYLLADEHQDANAAQNTLLTLLASYHDHPNIFVVGDPDQAIYRFQGASVENFLSFKEEYPDAVVISLRENYRSNQTILNTISHLSGGDAVGEGKGPLHAARETEEYPVRLWSAPDQLSEYAKVAEDIESLMHSGEQPENIAVLFRRNRDANGIARALGKKGIPFHKQSGEDILHTPLIRDFVAILRTLSKYGDHTILPPALYAQCFAIDPLDLFKIQTESRKKKIALYDFISNHSQLENAGVGEVSKITQIAALLSKWKKHEGNGLLPLIEEIATESGFFTTLFEGSGAIELLEQYRKFFTFVESLVRENPDATTATLIERLDLVTLYRIPLFGSGVDMHKKAVHLLTAHRAKGLEFTHVYVVGASSAGWEKIKNNTPFSGIFEIGRTSTPLDDEKTEDEARLFYVALSRARKRLTISYPETTETGKPTVRSVCVDALQDVPFETEAISGEGGLALLVQPPILPPPLPREYLAQLFLREGLSATALSNYLKDPWLYFFRNLIRIPEHPEPHLLYGTAIHASLERFFRAGANGTLPNAEALLQFFGEEIERVGIPDTHFRETKKRGEEALRGYHGARVGEWNILTLPETKSEVAVNTTFDGVISIPLRGKIDRLDLVNDGLMVTDYKTGKPKTRNDIEGKTASSDGAYKQQLVFYKLLLSLGGYDPLRRAVLDFVEPDGTGKYHQEVFEITDGEVETLKETLNRVIEEITSLSFWNTEPTKDNPYVALVESIRRQKI